MQVVVVVPQPRCFLLIWPQSMLVQWAAPFLGSRRFKTGTVRLIQVENFNPDVQSSWNTVENELDDRFVWLPWNWVTNARSLADVLKQEESNANWESPRLVSKRSLDSEARNLTQTGTSPQGVLVTSERAAAEAERFLVARSGKVSDGIHSSFNRRLCRPVVGWLSHTRITPNAVTLGGVVVSIVSGIAYARGSYWWYVAGALLAFIAGLFDEIDGMLARIKFADSPFGTYLESFADSLSYVFLFGGITIGLYRQHGTRELWIGGALLIGTVLALVITTQQRKRATSADRPTEYLGNFYRKLEQDKSNWISRSVRQIQGFQRRGIMIHYVFLFTVLGGLQVLFYLAVLGAHLTWTLALYYNRRFFSKTPNIPISAIPTSQEAS
jgi:phosphatidylglycerophosphate synthase